MNPLRKPLGPDEDLMRARQERRLRVEKMEAMRFWMPERPGDAADTVARMFDFQELEAILIRYLDAEIDCQELGYDLQNLAERITEGDAENSRELQRGRRE